MWRVSGESDIDEGTCGRLTLVAWELGRGLRFSRGGHEEVDDVGVGAGEEGRMEGEKEDEGSDVGVEGSNTEKGLDKGRESEVEEEGIQVG